MKVALLIPLSREKYRMRVTSLARNLGVTSLIVPDLKKEMGCAQARNVGIHLAIEEGFDHIALMDDDDWRNGVTTSPDADLVYTNVRVNMSGGSVETVEYVGDPLHDLTLIGMYGVPYTLSKAGALRMIDQYGEVFRSRQTCCLSGSFFLDAIKAGLSIKHEPRADYMYFANTGPDQLTKHPDFMAHRLAFLKELHETIEPTKLK